MSQISITGMILKNRYCVIDRIGKGGQGSLYLARDLDLGVNWVIKELPISQKRETKLLRLVSHPGLPRMIDYMERENYCYLVMERIEGKNLQEIMNERGPLDIPAVCSIALKAYEILSYLHQQNPPIVHGDIKPENFMMSDQGFLYLIDFGSAAVPYGQRRANVTGTVKYASDEQKNGEISEGNDYYSLGITLYHLLGDHRLRMAMHNPILYFTIANIVKTHCIGQKDLTVFRKYEHSFHGKNLIKYGFTCLILLIAVLGLFMGTIRMRERSAVISNDNPLDVSNTGVECLSEDASFYRKLSDITQIYVNVFAEEQQAIQNQEPVDAHLTRFDGPYISGSKFQKSAGFPSEEFMNSIKPAIIELLAEQSEHHKRIRLQLLMAYQAEYEGDMIEAKECYKKLLQEYPNRLDIYAEYGLFLLRQNEYTESKALWEIYQNRKTDCMNGDSDSGAQDVSGNVLAWEKWMEHGAL